MLSWAAFLLLLRNILVLSLLSLATLICRNRSRPGIQQHPGPSLAAYSNLWRLLDVWYGNAHRTQLSLHRRYGSVIRLGPNVLSFSSPTAIQDIYSAKKGMRKTAFYNVQSGIAHGRPIESLFTTLDETYHVKLRRTVNPAFTMSSALSCEPVLDNTTLLFLNRTREIFARPNSPPCDLSTWLRYYVFDNIGTLSVGERFGFLDRNEDVDSIISSIEAKSAYGAVVGQLPALDYIWTKNPIRLWLMQKGYIQSSNAIARFSFQHISDRAKTARSHSEEQQQVEDKRANSRRNPPCQNSKGVDLLTHFRQIQAEQPTTLTNEVIAIMATSLVNAGAYTTAASLSAVFYYLLQYPATLRTLTAELDTAVAEGIIPPNPFTEIASFTAVQKLPYLDAVIQESFRLFPPISLLLERKVPPEGAVIDGHFIPGGTIVGSNAWVAGRSLDIFGPDADIFRPERWLEDEKNLSRMRTSMLHFGAGARNCIGRSISLMELYKTVPSFLLAFEYEWANARRDWKVENQWFMRQSDFNVRIRTKV